MMKTREHKVKKRLSIYIYIYIYIYILVGVLMIVVCGYGHAALNTELQISGEATVKNSAPFGIQYMQEMTGEVCANAEKGATQQLIDKRDNKSYWIAKLNDNRCWMTQNLALDLTTEGLTSELSDLQSSSASAAKYTTTTNAEGKTVYVWDQNSKYPPRDTTVGAFAQSATNANYVSAKSSKGGANYVINSVSSYSSMTNEKVSSFAQTVWAQNVEGWSPTYVYNPAKGKYPYDETARTYDAHYLFGNLYQIGAATAGSSTASTSPNNPQSSICPKGWRLPQIPSGGKNEFEVLLGAYGFSNKAIVGDLNVSEPPLYFIRGGGNSTNSQFGKIGYVGFWWTSRSNSQAYGMAFDITGNAMESSKSSIRNTGRSVRCVAR